MEMALGFCPCCSLRRNPLSVNPIEDEPTWAQGLAGGSIADSTSPAQRASSVS